MNVLAILHNPAEEQRQTVFVDANSKLPVGELFPTFMRILGLKDEQHVAFAIDGAMVDPATPVHATGLREGSWISACVGSTKPFTYLSNGQSKEHGYVQIRVVSGSDAGRIYYSTTGFVRVGTERDCLIKVPKVTPVPFSIDLEIGNQQRFFVSPAVADSQPMTSKRQLQTGAKSFVVPVYVDGSEVEERSPIKLGQQVSVPGCVLELSAEVPETAIIEKDERTGERKYNRPPRIRRALRKTSFKLPMEPSAPQKASLPWLSSLLPLLLAGGMAYFTKNLMMLTFGLMSPVMMISSSISGNRASKKKYKQDQKDYKTTKEKVETSARKAVEAERAKRLADSPDPTRVLQMCVTPSPRLWERRILDDSWLLLRVGVANQASSVTLEDPEALEHQREKKWMVRDLPATVDLTHAGCVGFAGNSDVIHPVVEWCVAQVGALHSSKDVSLYLLNPQTAKNSENAGNDTTADDWEIAAWLPHAKPAYGQNTVRTVGFATDEIASRIAELIQLLESRQDALKQDTASTWSGPSVVVVLQNSHLLRAMPGIVRILREGPGVGIFSICIDADRRLLPEECQSVVEAIDSELLIESSDGSRVEGITPDLPSQSCLMTMALSLASIVDASPGEDNLSIPTASRLLDVLKMVPPTSDAIESRWIRHPRSTRFPVGESMDGKFEIDIAKDGPHGLIAGTTGSGKSELLQTIVASLAVENTPEAMTFVLVDYKGGAAFKDCVDLPHTVGMVTDLDNHLVERALESLGAELNYREHVLAQAGAKDLDDYVDLVEKRPDLEPVPRLLIVIDEFASLARELPDFVTGLVNIAQRGRSLGIHLLLATQRPGGVVSPEIRANTNLRIALRVTDQMESEDVINSKEAATISKTTPGRAYVRLGSNSLIPFQSARVGGRYVDPSKQKDESSQTGPTVKRMDMRAFAHPAPASKKAEKKKADVELTDLKVLVDQIKEASDKEGFAQPRKPWLPALSKEVSLDDLEKYTRDPEVAQQLSRPGIMWGLCDYPKLQKQRPLYFDLQSTGHYFIVGTARTGKSTALRSLAVEGASRYSADKLHMYVLDCANGSLAPLSSLPNVGAVVLRHETGKVIRLISKLRAELTRRQQLLSALGFATIDEYNAAHAAKSGSEDSNSQNGTAEVQYIPHIMVMLDSWDGFNAVFGTLDNGSLIDSLLFLLRESASVGMHFVITGDKQLLSGKTSTYTENKLLLRLVDKTDFTLIGMKARSVPDNLPEGRGFLADGAVEAQVAVVKHGANGQEVSAFIREIGTELSKRDADIPKNLKPFTVEEIPTAISLSDAQKKADLREWEILLGVGGEDNTVLTYNPHKQLPTFMILGTPRSRKTTALVTATNSALAQGYRVVLAAPKDNALRKFEGVDGVLKLFTEPEQITEDALSSLFTNEQPTIFIADDAESLRQIPGEKWLRSAINNLEKYGMSIIAAGDIDEMPRGFSGWLIDLKKNRQGIVLRPTSFVQADTINAKVKKSQVHDDDPVGRGFYQIDGVTSQIQMAESHEPIVPAASPRAKVPVSEVKL